MAMSICYPHDTLKLATMEDLFWVKIWQLLMKEQIGDNLIYYRGCHWFWKLSAAGDALELWLLVDGKRVTDTLLIPPEYQ